MPSAELRYNLWHNLGSSKINLSEVDVAGPILVKQVKNLLSALCAWKVKCK